MEAHTIRVSAMLLRILSHKRKAYANTQHTKQLKCNALTHTRSMFLSRRIWVIIIMRGRFFRSKTIFNNILLGLSHHFGHFYVRMYNTHTQSIFFRVCLSAMPFIWIQRNLSFTICILFVPLITVIIGSSIVFHFDFCFDFFENSR